MYSVALDPSGNYLLLGGSGDEYSYSETDPNTGWSSDIWVSYLVVLDVEVIIHNIMNYCPEYVTTFVNTYLQGTTLFEGVYGEKDANNAGEYLSIDKDSGDLMVYCDSDTVGGGFAYLKLSPN